MYSEGYSGPASGYPEQANCARDYESDISRLNQDAKANKDFNAALQTFLVSGFHGFKGEELSLALKMLGRTQMGEVVALRSRDLLVAEQAALEAQKAKK